MKKTVIICRDPYDQTTWTTEQVNDVCAYLKQQYEVFPGFAKIYHGLVAESQDVTPKSEADIEKLQQLEGVFYIVEYGGWVQLIYYAVVAIMAIYSVYTIMTMPKPQGQQQGSTNNELQGRSNSARLKGRIPDIFGIVRAYPDLAAVTYSFYNDNGREVEEALMCVGRGYYDITDVKDADTAAEGIDGMSVSVYDPGVSIIGSETIYKTGVTFTELPFLVMKSSSINGQSLKKADQLQINEDKTIFFTSGGVINNTSSSFNLDEYFEVGDGIIISGAQYGLSDFVLSGTCEAHSDFTIKLTTMDDVIDFNSYKGLTLTGALFTEAGEVRDLSGDYEVTSVIRTNSIEVGYFDYVIQLKSPKQVNYNWNYVIDVDGYAITAGITLTKSESGINLDDTYSVSSVTQRTITLANASIVNSDWSKLDTLYSGSTLGQTSSVSLSLVSSQWVGWFDVYLEDATHCNFNLYFPNGLYNVTSEGKTVSEAVDITMQYYMIDNSGNRLTETTEIIWHHDVTSRDSFGITKTIELPQNGNIRFRLCKSYYQPGMNPVHEIKVKDVYLYHEYDKDTYPGVTMVRARQVATDGALTMKERKLNMLVTRKLAVDGTGDLVATKDAGQALINMALDPYIGRRSVNEIDIEQIKTEITAIKTYFSSSDPAEFSYTLDDAELSFEEQAGMVASACFSECYRYGNKLRMRFEQPQETSVLLFNHRNKVPQSEKRTYTFGIQKDYDGIKLEYTDPDDDERVNYYLSYNSATGEVTEDSSATNPLEITTSGIRNAAVAKTRAWREWNKLQYQRVSVDFDALDESELLMRNDRVLVADNTVISTQDGEVVSQNGFILTLSQNVEFKDGVDYYCFLQLSDGSTQSILCHAGEMTNEIILTESPRLPLVIDPDRYVKTLYTVVESSETDKQAFMLTEMSPNDQMTNKLTCINYDARYYEKDHSYI